MTDLSIPKITDQNDESLNRWKASLGLNAGEPIGDPNDPRKCIIKSLALEVEGRSDVVIELTEPGALSSLKDKPFTIKEGARFRIKVVFQVNHEVLSGLKYLQVVKRKGIRVSKDEEMLVSPLITIALGSLRIFVRVSNSLQGSYAPNTTGKPVYEKKCKFIIPPFFAGNLGKLTTLTVNPEEAPSGLIARGHYNAVSKFVDDDDHTHLQFEWSFDIAKDW